MKRAIKQSYGSFSRWWSHFIFSLFVAGLIHLSLSSIDIVRQGYPMAYLTLRADIAGEEVALLGFHPVLSSQVAYRINQLDNFLHLGKSYLKEKGLTQLKKNNLPVMAKTVEQARGLLSKGIALCKKSFALIFSIAQLLFYKCLVFLYALPLLVLSTMVGSVDGLIHRAVRTEEMGRESSFLFHKFSRLSSKVINTAMTVYFVLPISLGLFGFLFPMSVLACVLSSATTRHLKKYL